ncbi:MAG TPA: hypothetical protein VJ866_15305 [Pyrinomonadaceae bacterium]|nr:hypothetical protein [Pyrinomonadaceae bacterium]
MRTRYAVGFAALLVAAAFCGAYAASHAPANANAPAAATSAEPAPDVSESSPQQSVFPDRACPDLMPEAISNCCLWQFYKQGDGKRRAEFGTPYACPAGQTVQGAMTMTISLTSPGTTCDPLLNMIPNASVLEAKGRLIRRADGFGDFVGDFVIRNPAGVNLFNGCIETIDRVGTHRSCEACNPTSHFEGWLTGRGVTPKGAHYAIRASIAGRGLLPSPQSATESVSIDINGDIINCP